MATGAKTVRWRILIWLLPLQVLIFAGYEVWLESRLTEAAGSADPVLVHESLQPLGGQVRTIRIATAALCVIVLLSTAVTIRLQLERHLRRPLMKLLANAEAIGSGESQRPIERPRQPGLALLADSLNRSAERIAQQQREIQENARLAGVGQTVAGLSHTLKNVLNGLRAGQFVLDRAMKTGDQEKLRKGLRVTRSSVHRIERLIFDMLNYVKDRDPKREPLDPNDIIRNVVEELKRMAEGWGIELRADTDDGVGLVALDRLEIYRALVDLATNAIEACTEGGTGDLVVLGSRGAPDEVVLTVQDNGVGMTQEVLASLYTRFVSTKATGGTGLGMVVVRKIVDEHGGTIEVDSAPGEGTTFRIHLPRTGGDGSDEP